MLADSIQVYCDGHLVSGAKDTEASKNGLSPSGEEGVQGNLRDDCSSNGTSPLIVCAPEVFGAGTAFAAGNESTDSDSNDGQHDSSVSSSTSRATSPSVSDPTAKAIVDVRQSHAWCDPAGFLPSMCSELCFQHEGSYSTVVQFG